MFAQAPFQSLLQKDSNFHVCSKLQQITLSFLLSLEDLVDCQRLGAVNMGQSEAIRTFSLPEPPTA